MDCTCPEEGVLSLFVPQLWQVKIAKNFARAAACGPQALYSSQILNVGGSSISTASSCSVSFCFSAVMNVN